MAKTMMVYLVAADREVWSGEATVVNARTADGEYDHVAEQAFFMCGGLDDVERKWDEIQKSL